MNSAPPLARVAPRPEAKTLRVPFGAISIISPADIEVPRSATNRLPLPSKASPSGLLLRPVANVLSTPVGLNSRMLSFPKLPSVETKRLPDASNARSNGA